MECNQQRSSYSSSGYTDNKGKILLKFKIPKSCSSAGCSSSSAEENMNMNMMISNNSKRVCPECNKEFESGKALGGHMRIHAQPVNKQHLLFNNYSRSDSDNSMSDYSVSCSVCDKEFPSMRSLFGHMRCHPERDWRGIRPPRRYNSLSLSEDDDDDDGDIVFDCTQLMPKWPVKARRGRKGIKRGLSVGCDDDEEEIMLRDCLDGLMLLNHVRDSSDLSTLGAAVEQISGSDQHQEEVANGGSWTGNNREEEYFDDLRLVGNCYDEQVGTVDNSPVPVMRKMATEEGGSSDHVMKECIGSVGQEGNNAASAGHVVENHHVEVESDGMNTEFVLGGYRHFDGINDKDNQGENIVTGNSKNNKAKKMKMVMELNQSGKASGVGSSVQAAAATVATDKYKCSTCDKTFSSHQALGGHRSSHNKFKVTIINGDSSTKKSVSAFAPPDQKFDQSHQQLNTSHDQVNRVLMSEERATKRNSIDEVGGSSKADHISSSVHQCSVCNKIFASGQALGGHKRCHWTAPGADAQTEAQAQAPAQPQAQPQPQLTVRSSGEEASTQAGGKRIRLMGFDLNVPASMVDDAAQDGGAAW